MLNFHVYSIFLGESLDKSVIWGLDTCISFLTLEKLAVFAFKCLLIMISPVSVQVLANAFTNLTVLAY